MRQRHAGHANKTMISLWISVTSLPTGSVILHNFDNTS